MNVDVIARRLDLWVADAPASRRLLLDVAAVADGGVRRVAIVGEPGSGRDAAARAIHQWTDTDDERPFIRVDGAAALAGARALWEARDLAGATVVLRPGCRAAPHALDVIFRSVEDHLPDARVCVVVHGEQAARAEGVRGAAVVFVPPLRSRRPDIPALAHRFAEEACERDGWPVRPFDSAALDLLSSRQWPGNVRELRDVVWRACAAARGQAITLEDLGCVDGTVDVSSLRSEDLERILLEKALHERNGNMTAVGRQLGFSRGSLFRKVREYGLLGAKRR